MWAGFIIISALLFAGLVVLMILGKDTRKMVSDRRLSNRRKGLVTLIMDTDRRAGNDRRGQMRRYKDALRN